MEALLRVCILTLNYMFCRYENHPTLFGRSSYTSPHSFGIRAIAVPTSKKPIPVNRGRRPIEFKPRYGLIYSTYISHNRYLGRVSTSRSGASGRRLICKAFKHETCPATHSSCYLIGRPLAQKSFPQRICFRLSFHQSETPHCRRNSMSQPTEKTAPCSVTKVPFTVSMNNDSICLLICPSKANQTPGKFPEYLPREERKRRTLALRDKNA